MPSVNDKPGLTTLLAEERSTFISIPASVDALVKNHDLSVEQAADFLSDAKASATCYMRDNGSIGPSENASISVLLKHARDTGRVEDVQDGDTLHQVDRWGWSRPELVRDLNRELGRRKAPFRLDGEFSEVPAPLEPDSEDQAQATSAELATANATIEALQTKVKLLEQENEALRVKLLDPGKSRNTLLAYIGVLARLAFPRIRFDGPRLDGRKQIQGAFEEQGLEVDPGKLSEVLKEANEKYESGKSST